MRIDQTDLGESVEVYHAMLLLPKNCSVFLGRQPWVSLADLTLLVGFHKCPRNFWFNIVEDCYIIVRMRRRRRMRTRRKRRRKRRRGEEEDDNEDTDDKDEDDDKKGKEGQG